MPYPRTLPGLLLLLWEDASIDTIRNAKKVLQCDDDDEIDRLLAWCRTADAQPNTRHCCFMRRVFEHGVESWGVFDPFSDDVAFPEAWTEPLDAIREGWEPYAHDSSSGDGFPEQSMQATNPPSRVPYRLERVYLWRRRDKGHPPQHRCIGT